MSNPRSLYRIVVGNGIASARTFHFTNFDVARAFHRAVVSSNDCYVSEHNLHNPDRLRLHGSLDRALEELKKFTK